MSRPDPAAVAPANPVFIFITRRAAWIVAAAVLLTLGALAALVDFGAGRVRLQIDPSLDPLVASEHPDRQHYEQVRRRFGLDEVVLVVVHSADAYSLEALQRLDRLTRALFELPGVAAARSLTSVPLARSGDGDLVFERVTREDLADPRLPARLRSRVADNPLVQGQLVSADGRSAAIAVVLEAQPDGKIGQPGLIDTIIATADRERAAGVQIWVTGAAVVHAATSRTVLQQLQWALPAIALLLTVVLALTFRSLRAVLLPLAAIGFALIWTLAVLAMVGRPLNLITSLVPPLLITMGLAYCAHVMAEFESLIRRGGSSDPRERVVRLMQETGSPVLLTGFTTSVGLLALLLNELPAVREFAWLSALGVVFSALLVLTFVPAALCLTAPAVPARPLPGGRLFEQGSRALGRFDMQRRKGILFIAAAVFLVAVASSAQIQVGDRFVGIFPPDSRVRADFEAVNRAMGGVNPLSIVLDGIGEEPFTEPGNLRALADLQAWLQAQPEVGKVSGLADQMRLLNRILAGAENDALPANRTLAKQLLFFGGGEALSGVVNGDHSSTLIELRLRVDDTAAVGAFMQRLQNQLVQMPAGIEARITGDIALVTRSLQSVTTGQLQSLALALLLIYLCLSAQFTSFRVGLKASLPTLLQTAIYFGALGLSGVLLNSTTALVECLVLGLAVDDTIHYLARFNAAAKRTGSEAEAAQSALSAVLRPVTLTKGILAIGFLMLVTGELQNQVLFGYLAAFTLFGAWLVDIFVTPAFMGGMRIVTLWDSLRLNLGRDVQATIPLFAGLSTRQARIFALMSNLQTMPAGARVITEGDAGGDVFVVIDGELSVWIERDGARVVLNTLRRGAVLGEAGYFGQKRTANIDTLTPVRLLRFDDDDRERICKRYPAIAARVFLNMNRVQAERVASQMQRIH